MKKILECKKEKKELLISILNWNNAENDWDLYQMVMEDMDAAAKGMADAKLDYIIIEFTRDHFYFYSEGECLKLKLRVESYEYEIEYYEGDWFKDLPHSGDAKRFMKPYDEYLNKHLRASDVYVMNIA